MTVASVLPPLVASACPRACRRALTIGTPADLEQSLRSAGLEPCRGPTVRCSVGAVVIVIAHETDKGRLAGLAGVLTRRGRLFALCPDRLLPGLLTALARAGLPPKRLLLGRPADPEPWSIVIASAGRPGGLSVERLVGLSCPQA